jgi:Flp pilus assembly pilin Flp
VKKFIKNISGATAIEYVLIAAGISLAVAASAFVLGDRIVDLFDLIKDLLGGA